LNQKKQLTPKLNRLKENMPDPYVCGVPTPLYGFLAQTEREVVVL